MSLDDRLTEIYVNVADDFYWEGSYSEDPEEEINKEIIGEFREQIKQAFIDDGWKHDGFSEAYQHMMQKKTEGVEPTWVVVGGVKFMTGQEWYDKFFSELRHFHYNNESKDDVFRLAEEVRNAAKKAAGIE